MEFSGTVDAVGDGVDPAWVGRTVMGITGGGAYAEQVVADAGELVPVPAGVQPVTAAAIPEVFMTAYDAVFLQAGLREHQWLLVHAVGSGVGTAAVQLAVRAGAHVIGTSRTADKLRAAEELGMEHGVPGDDAWPDAVLEATEGRGVDVVLDLVGGPYLAGNQRVIRKGGRHVVVGIPGGAKAEVDLGQLMRKRVTLLGTVLRSRPLEEKVALARAFEHDVLPGFEDGTLRPIVDRIFPVEDAAEAHRYMEANRNFGKILLRW